MSIATEIPKSTTSNVIDDVRTSLTSQLETRARIYFPQLDEQTFELRLVRESRRIYSAFHEFEVSDGKRSHGIIVKIPCLPSTAENPARSALAAHRPRLFGNVDPRQMAELEFTTLTAIDRHIKNLGDPRLGAIRPLELLRGPNSVVMEKHHGASFRLIHLAARRIPAGRNALPFSPQEATQNAGVWLREYHRMTPLRHSEDRMATRSDFLEAIGAQTGYLVDQGENRAFLRSIRAQLEAHAQRTLDTQFDLATGHGDFAPRNLLIGRQNQVTVLDTLARWRAPIFEDLAMFLLGLRAPAAQVVSLGAAYNRQTLHHLETQFLTYYFDGAPIPLASIRIFEGLLLLDRWGAFVQRAELAKGSRRRLYNAWRLVTLRRFLMQFFRHTFRELDQLC